MEIKKGLALVFVVLGLVTASYGKQADDSDEATERRGRIFAMPFSEEKFQQHRDERSEKQKTKQTGDRIHFKCCYPTPAKEDDTKNLYFDLAVGMIKYNIPKTTVVNALGGSDTVSLIHASLLPMVRGGMGIEFVGVKCITNDEHTTRARLGLEVSFAKRGNNAVETLYTGAASTAPVILGTQDVTRGELMVLASYDLVRDLFALDGGLGLVGGALKDFSLYQPPTTGSEAILASYYTGQTIKPNKASFGGFIGATLCHRFKSTERVRLDFSYRCVFNTVTYGTTIYQYQPGINANQTYQNGFSMGTNPVPAPGVTPQIPVLQAQPKFKIRAQEIAFGIVAEF